MEIRITTNQILTLLQIISWVIFLGLCVEAGAVAVNTFITLFVNPAGVQNFWEEKEYLARVLAFDRGYFIVITSTMIIVTVLKAIMFYMIVKLFVEKKLRISQPFSTALRNFIIKQSYMALGIGIFSHTGYKYSAWLTKQGMGTADLLSLHISGADVWIFMAVILFVIAQVVKKGIEVQTENDLTI